MSKYISFRESTIRLYSHDSIEEAVKQNEQNKKLARTFGSSEDQCKIYKIVEVTPIKKYSIRCLKLTKDEEFNYEELRNGVYNVLFEYKTEQEGISGLGKIAESFLNPNDPTITSVSFNKRSGAFGLYDLKITFDNGNKYYYNLFEEVSYE